MAGQRFFISLLVLKNRRSEDSSSSPKTTRTFPNIFGNFRRFQNILKDIERLQETSENLKDPMF